MSNNNRGTRRPLASHRGQPRQVQRPQDRAYPQGDPQMRREPPLDQGPQPLQQGPPHQQSLLGPPPTQQAPQRPLPPHGGVQAQKNLRGQKIGVNKQGRRQPSTASGPQQGSQHQQSLLGPPPTQQAPQRSFPPQRGIQDRQNPGGQQAENANQWESRQPSTSGSQQERQHQHSLLGPPPHGGPQVGSRGNQRNPAQPLVGFEGFQNPHFVVVPLVRVPKMRKTLHQEQKLNLIEPQSPEEQAENYLDQVPHNLWGTKEDRDSTITHFNTWRQNTTIPQTWIADNILNMPRNIFEGTNGAMNGIYSFTAYVRMYNFMRWNENDKLQCTQLKDLKWPQPFSPKRVAPGHFRRPRGGHPDLELNEDSAMKYLERQISEEHNVYEKFIGTFENWTWADVQHWIAANILDVSSKDAMLNGGRVRGPVNEQVMRRMLNWIDMDETWRIEFMNLAYIPMRRKAVRWDPEMPETIDCLRDTPNHNPHLRLSKNLAINYMNQTCDSPLSNEQTEYLYDQWNKKNPEYSQFAAVAVQGEGQVNVPRMGAWLRLHYLWKKVFFENDFF